MIRFQDTSFEKSKKMNLFEINREMDKLLMKYRSNGVKIDKHPTQVDSGVSKDKDRCDKSSSTSDIDKKTYLCHICDIRVPKSHKEDHVNSTTHISLLKLANHATDRINKHISQQIEQLSYNSKNNSNPSDNTNSSSYYCVQCNLLLEKDAEDSHKSEEEHQKSVNRALFVATLFKCYTGLNTDDFMAEISRWSSGYGTKGTENSKNTYTVQDDVENNNDPEVTVNIAEKALNETARDVDSAKTAHVKTENNATKLFLQQLQFLLQTDVKELSKSKSREVVEYQSSITTRQRELTVTELVHALSAKKSKVEIEVDAIEVKEEVAEIFDGVNTQQILKDFAEEQIEVKALDGATLLLNKQYYHGIWEASGALCCLLCTLELETDDKFTEHIQSKRHIALVATPVEDKNGLRKVTNNGTIRHNCVLCNTMHFDHNKHVSSEPHKEAMTKALPSLHQQPKSEFRIPYDISLTTADVEMVDKPLTKSQENTTENKEKVKKTIQRCQRRPKYQKVCVFCNLCGVKMRNDMRIITTHVNGRKHQYFASKATVFDIEHNAPDMLAYFYYREQNARLFDRRFEQDFYLDLIV